MTDHAVAVALLSGSAATQAAAWWFGFREHDPRTAMVLGFVALAWAALGGAAYPRKVVQR